MSSDKPQKKSPQNNNDDGLEFDRSEALKKAILKLKEQGKIKDLPPDLFGMEETDTSDSDMTIASASSGEAQSSADVIDKEDEKQRWSAVLSGWDVPEQETENKDTKRDTSEIEVVVTPEQDEKIAQVAAEAADSENWGSWDEPVEPNEDSEPTILDDWSAPEVIEQDEAEKAVVVRKQIAPQSDPEKQVVPAAADTPWTLQQFFNGEIDLDVELQKRFPAVPIVSAVKFRTLGSEGQQRVATLTTTDGTASVIIDANALTKEIQLSFTYGSMLTLRYSLSELSDADRSRWLELMRREKGGLAFLWGPTRWQKDYLICISRQYATKIYAFSPNSFESVVRLSQDVMDEVVKWLDEIWSYEPKNDKDDDAPLLTW